MPIRSNRQPSIPRPPNRHETLKIRLDAIDCTIKQWNASLQGFEHENLCCKAQSRGDIFLLAKVQRFTDVLSQSSLRTTAHARSGAAAFALRKTLGDAGSSGAVRAPVACARMHSRHAPQDHFVAFTFPGPCSGTVAPPLRVKPPAAERRFFRDPWPEPGANAKARFRGPTSCRCWRPGSELNRRTRICSPLHNHSATRPVDCAETGAKRAAFQAPDKVKPRCRGFVFASSGSPGGNNLERETRLELATPTLARSCSTN